jgi:dihydropteroate synthase
MLLSRLAPDRPLLMGILNVTPDSFSDPGRFFDPAAAADRARAMIDEGADIIDIGGESTRPGAAPVTADEELRRVLPVIEAVRKRSDAPVSIDTSKSIVARAALAAGANIINDVTAGRSDPEMFSLAASAGAAIVLMHMQGEPRTMQKAPAYGNVVREVSDFLLDRARAAEAAGVARENVLIDPGIGFGKTIEHNRQLLAALPSLVKLGLPVLLGHSRKAFIGAALDLPVDSRLEGTLAVTAWAAMSGVRVVRVHDVRENARVVRMVAWMKSGGSG